MQINEEKINLRKLYKKRRDSVADRILKSNFILHNFLVSNIYNSSEQILSYYSIKSEVRTIPLIEKGISEGKKIALPSCINSNGDMKFYHINDLKKLNLNSFGIMEPEIDCTNEVNDFSNSVIIVPAITFDMSGYRLGYGGGYYDKFLQNIKNSTSISVGLCYNELLCDKLPHDDYDISVDYIVTEKNLFKV